MRKCGGHWRRVPAGNRGEGGKTDRTISMAGRILPGGKGRRESRQMHSFCPVLLNGQVPFPGEVVVLVVIGEEGLVVVGASGQHALGSLFDWSEELILLRSRPIATNHKCCFIH